MAKQDEINGYFLEVIRWLKAEHGYTQEYIVEKAHLAQNAISKIKNGKANVGDETIVKLCNAFNLNPEFFYGRSPYKSNLEKSREKMDDELQKAKDVLYRTSGGFIDPSSAVNASIAAYVKLVEQLESQLADKDKELASRLADKDTIIAEKQARIVALEQIIADKDALIRDRDARILELERRIAQSNADDLSKYPFSLGAAEHSDKPNL